MNNLVEIFNELSGASFIGIDQRTSVTLRGGKKNIMQGRVNKVTTGLNVMVYTNKTSSAYVNMVRKRLNDEDKNPDDYVQQPRRWGERIPNSPFITHKGAFYLEYIVLHSGQVHYELDGEEIDPDKIEGLPPTPTGGEQGGLENKVIIRTVKVDSILAIRANRRQYQAPFTVEF